MQMREKVGKSRNTVFPMICGSGGSKSRLAKAAGAELARWEMKNCMPLWREARFQVKMYKAHQVRTTFGSWDVEKVHTVVAQSTFPSQKCKKLTGTEHFWTFRRAFAWLASIFRGRRSTLDRWSGKIAKRIGTRLSALHSTFHFWRKSRRIHLFLMLLNTKIEEVSQNCFVLDVVQFKKWRSVAELLSFLMLSTSKNEE